MKKFAFPLDKVLEVRELRRLIAEEKLGALLKEMYLIEQALDMAKQKELENKRVLMAQLDEQKGGVDLYQIKATLAYGAAIDEDIRELEKKLDDHMVLVREAQEEVIAKTKDKKALEQLKEKHLAEYMDMYWWERSKELDEIGTMYFTRNGKEVI